MMRSVWRGLRRSTLMPARWRLGVSLEELRQRQLVVGLGSMKSGTTWLSGYLQSHPDFLHSPVKEMNVFNQIFPNPFDSGWSDYRLLRMEKLVLSFGRHPARLPRAAFRERFDRLRALAQLGALRDCEAYLAYFAERIQRQRHFGEITPAYSHLPADALRQIGGLTRDVRFLFLMRDPTSRAASHLRHLRRRVRRDESLDALIAEVGPGHPVFRRSDYRDTLQALREAELLDRAYCIIYEQLFRQEQLDALCGWLGMAHWRADFDQRLNPAVGEGLSAAQLTLLRERLAPIYEGLRHEPLVASAQSWRWEG